MSFRARYLTPGHPPPKPVVTVAVAISILSMATGWIGDALLAELVDRHPLLLMALNPRNRVLALVSNQVDAVSFYTVGFLRLVASDPINYLLGLWFGQRAIAWVGRRSRTYGPLVDNGAEQFRRFAPAVIFFMPNQIICALAGFSGVRVRTFFIANVTGTIARLIMVRQLSSYFEEPIGDVVGFIGRYRTPILILSVLSVIYTVFVEFRGDDSELQTLAGLDDLVDEPSDDETDQPAQETEH